MNRSKQASVSIKTILILLVGLALESVHVAEGQQAGKIFRIGFLDRSTSGSAVYVDAFRQELSKLGWSEGKILSSSTDLQKEILTAYLSLRRSWFVLR